MSTTGNNGHANGNGNVNVNASGTNVTRSTEASMNDASNGSTTPATATATTTSTVLAVTPAPGDALGAVALSPKTGVNVIFLAPPPSNVQIPPVPAGAAALGGTHYKSVLPKKIELAALPGAVADLQRMANFDQTFGIIGLRYAQAFQAFDVGNQWSSMRTASRAWDRYSMTQEGIAWTNIRAILLAMQPIFAAIQAGDPSFASTYPSLATLLGARKAIARKGVSTKRANKEAVARGEEPVHGGVGKRRKSKAEKEAAAAQKAAAAAAAKGGAGAAPGAVPGAPGAVAPGGTPSAANGGSGGAGGSGGNGAGGAPHA